MGNGTKAKNVVDGVLAWEERVTIPTYPVPEPDRNPMFLEKRVYQGSTGKVYPNPFTDRVSDEKVDRQYTGVFLENEFIRLMVLPEIGGRIHVGHDKTNGYDFFYRQNVIKPALVGLLGPWISGGVEFNWPQHHRPSTFMPVEFQIEEHEDGSRTIWLSEHEPMNRMKGMVGICLYPGKAFIEAKARLYNRTPLVQTFLWWANAGIRVHDRYQAFFPPDVTFVADHAKRAVSAYPVARDFYYGVDYRAGVDLAWYKNIPVPTSYMVTKSNYDFLGGYDHEKRAGMVHVANRHISPGKKMWTWGNAEFGYAWDRELTDRDGPYIELMAGVFTDNQPDFSWIHPGETKTFRQYWYPIQEIGPVKNANRLVAVNLDGRDGEWQVGVCSTEPLIDIHAAVTLSGDLVLDCAANVSPGNPFTRTFRLADTRQYPDLVLRVLAPDGRELIRYRVERPSEGQLPAPAIEPLAPEETATTDELYLSGLHLAQYRHATRRPEAYWKEALRRDPEDARCNNSMGLLRLSRGEFAEAEAYFRGAIARLTRHNPNPYDGEPFYNLALALKYQGLTDKAYAAFYKATWTLAWKSPAYYELACLDCMRGDLTLACEHLDRSLETNALSLKPRNLKTAILRRLGRKEESSSLARETSQADPLDPWSRYEQVLLTNGPAGGGTPLELGPAMLAHPQTFLDVAYDYASAGLWTDAAGLAQLLASADSHSGARPMVQYALGYFGECTGDRDAAARYRAQGSAACPDYCFPARIEDMVVLESALRANPGDARAHYYLGNLLYDKLRRAAAIEHWESACRLDPAFSISWRNLGIACFNVLGDAGRALDCYQQARAANPTDARLLYELDQLRKRTGVAPGDRLAALEERRHLVDQRDDLTIELVTLYNQAGRHQEALEILAARRFHPWEGGEGLVSGQFVMAHLLLGRSALAGGEAAGALHHFEAARTYPHNLGEGKHLLTEEGHLQYFSGVAAAMAGQADEARRHWEAAARGGERPSLFTYYRAAALGALGRVSEADSVLRQLHDFAEAQGKAEVKIPYFATSLPNFLLFEDDMEKRNRVDCLFLRGLANFGLGRIAQAAEDLRAVLQLDGNHIPAQEELRSWSVRQQEAVPRN